MTEEQGAGAERAHVGRAPKRHAVAKVLLSTLVVLALVSGMGVAYFYRHLNGNLNTVDVTGKIIGPRPTKPADVGPKGPINILVMGTDSRDCAGCDIDGVAGGDGSDTTILLHLSADRKTAYGVSIPRDSLVDRPECLDKDDPSEHHPAEELQMWNEAFSVGGAACTVAQVEHTTGIRVDHYVTVDFASFKNMVDAIGGVEVCVPEDIDSSDFGIYIKKGTRKISGKAALAYVRVRHGVGDGTDLGRVKRQQAFIGAMAGQVLSADTLANPIKVTRFLNAATKSLTLDMDLTDLVKLALQFKSVGSDGIQFITIPNHYASVDPVLKGNPAYNGRVVWDTDAAVVWRKLLHDKPLPAEFLGGAIHVDHLPGQTDSPSSSPTASASPSTSPTDSATPSAPASLTPSGSPSPTLEPNGRTAAENTALKKAGLCT